MFEESKSNVLPTFKKKKKINPPTQPRPLKGGEGRRKEGKGGVDLPGVSWERTKH